MLLSLDLTLARSLRPTHAVPWALLCTDGSMWHAYDVARRWVAVSNVQPGNGCCQLLPPSAGELCCRPRWIMESVDRKGDSLPATAMAVVPEHTEIIQSQSAGRTGAVWPRACWMCLWRAMPASACAHMYEQLLLRDRIARVLGTATSDRHRVFTGSRPTHAAVTPTRSGGAAWPSARELELSDLFRDCPQ